MSRALTFCVASLVALVAGEAAVAHPAGELPLGGSSAFREPMMGWVLPTPEPTPAAALPSPPKIVPLPRLSSSFGYRLHPLDGKLAMHRGIDIPGQLGTEVHASSAGLVRFAGHAGGYGQMIELDHGNELQTRYAHLSRILVREGARVGQGETIALMGSTGRSTGSHLHFEVRQDGHATDPLRFFLADRPMAITVYSPAAPHLSQFARSRMAAEDGPN